MESPLSSPSVRIILVENHRLMAEGVDALLSKVNDITITGIFQSSQHAFDTLKKGASVDLVISDLWMENNWTGIQLLTRLQSEGISIPVLILSMDETPSSIRMALQAGAKGYLPKDCSSAELLKAIYRIVREEEIYLSPRLLTILVSEKTDSPKSLASDLPVLTKQELRVLTLIANEYENQEIADMLFVSVGTIETHRKNLMKKLKVKNAIALANTANRYGLTGNPLSFLPNQGKDDGS